MWIVEDSNNNVSVKSFPVGYPFLNIISGKPFLIERQNDEYLHTKSYLAGSMLSPFQLNMQLVKRAITIQLQPYGLYVLFGTPANEFHNQVLPIREFDPFFAEEMEELIEGNTPSEELLMIIEKRMINKLNVNKISDHIIPALSKILINSGNISIKELTAFLNISQRRLQQLFNQHIGLNPKKYCNIVKIQYHTYQILKNPNEHTFIPEGFYDQAHYIHELKKQTGMLPGDYQSYLCNPALSQAYLNSNIYFRHL